jgi:hypothetical protein
MPQVVQVIQNFEELEELGGPTEELHKHYMISKTCSHIASEVFGCMFSKSCSFYATLEGGFPGCSSYSKV